METVKGNHQWEELEASYTSIRTQGLRLKFAPGQGTNNKAELVTLWEALKLAKEKRVQNLQLFGDSKLTIDWANGSIQINAPRLHHLLRALRKQMAAFESITFQHIYIEVNTEADKLSKLALSLPPVLMEVTNFVNNQEVKTYVSL